MAEINYKNVYLMYLINKNVDIDTARKKCNITQQLLYKSLKTKYKTGTTIAYIINIKI